MDNDIIVREQLPYPFAHYADTFIGFHEALGAPLTLCGCQQSAIENHLQMCVVSEETQRKKEYPGWYATPYGAYPRGLLRTIERFHADPKHCLLRLVRFQKDICHRCNGRMPYGYYGFSDVPSGFFISHFRPYVNQACYGFGVATSGHVVLPQKCPDELKGMDAKGRLAAIENQVREAFSFPRIGVNRNQESALLLLVREILPRCNVVQHYRAPWLGALEIDMFIEDHKIGIEFQGIQHSEPMDHLGGENALRATQRRDSRKAKLCKQNGVKLVYVHEGEELTESNVRQIIHKRLSSVPLISPQVVARPPFDFNILSNGCKTRWTYYNDKHELSVSGEVNGMKVYMGGTDFDLTATVRHERVHSLRFWMHKPSGSLDVTIPLAETDALEVECHRQRKPMVEFFRVWSMFEPNIGVHEEEDKPNNTPEGICQPADGLPKPSV